MKNLKRFLTWLGTIIIEAIITLVFETKLKENSMFIKNHFIELFLLIIVSTTFIFFIIWFIKLVFYLKVKSKYYDIMLTNFQDQYPSHPCSVFKDDLKVFSKQERKYLKKYLNDMEILKIVMRGKNKCKGIFK